jgi:hypothetical protein
MVFPSGKKRHPQTVLVWPLKVAFKSPLAAFHRCKSFPEAVKIMLLHGEMWHRLSTVLIMKPPCGSYRNKTAA